MDIKRFIKILTIAIFSIALCTSPAFAGPLVTPAGTSKLIKLLKLKHNTETLSGAKVLLVSDDPVQKLDPNGSDRDVTLPAEASSTDLVFFVYNTANGAGEDLVIKDDSPATIVTLAPGMGMMFSCDGTTWLAMDDEGITYDAQAGTHTFGSSIVTSGGQVITSDTSSLLDLNPSGAGAKEVVSIVPSEAMGGVHWDGMAIDGNALDPSASGASIHGIHIDFSTVSQTNDPELRGLYITQPATYSGEEGRAAFRATGNGLAVSMLGREGYGLRVDGGIHNNYTAGSDAGATYAANDVIIDASSLDATSEVTGYQVQSSNGSPSGAVVGLTTLSYVAPIHQHIGTFASPGANLACRLTSGPTYTDVIDAQTLWVADDDSILIGHASATFNQIKFVWTTPATKDVVIDWYYYSSVGSTFVQFYPNDTAIDGGRANGVVFWDSADIPNWTTHDPDAGGGVTTTGYFIKAQRTRVSDPGPVVLLTAEILASTDYTWDKDGNLSIAGLNAVGNVSIQPATDSTTAVQVLDADGGTPVLNVDTTNERTGFNTVSPDTQVEVSKDAADTEVTISTYHDTEATAPKLTTRKAEGTEASHATPVDDNAVIGVWSMQGYDGSGWHEAARIEGRIDGTPSDGTDMPGEISFWTTPDGSATAVQRMTIDDGGNVGIGTTSPSELLHVYKDGNQAGIKLESTGDGNEAGILFSRESLNGVNKGLAFIRVQGDTSQDGGILEFGTDSNLALDSGDSAIKMVIGNIGNVGIGTTAPDARLEINHATGDNLRLTYNDGDGSATYYADLQTTSTGGMIIDTVDDTINLSGAYTIQDQSLVDNASAGASYWFDGVDNNVAVSDNANLDMGSNDFSVLVTTRPSSSSPADTMFVEKGGPEIHWNFSSTANEGFSLGMNNGTFRFSVSGDGGNGADITTSGTVVSDAEQVLVGVLDKGSTLKLYQNGDEVDSVATTSKSGGDISNALSFYVGASAAIDYELIGQISRTLLFNLALSHEEVMSLSSGGEVPYEYRGASDDELITDSDNTDFADGTINEWVLSTNGSGTLLYEGTDPGAEKVGELTGAGDESWLAASLPTTEITAFAPGKRYRISADFYVPAANTLKDVRVAAVNITNAGETFDTINGDTWTKISHEFTAGSDIDGGIHVGFKGSGVVAGDICYFDNISVTQIGCVLDLGPEGITAGTWVDQSGNNLHGALSGAIPIGLPRGEEQLLSITNVSFAADADTVLLTVPQGYSAVLDHAKIVAGADAASTDITIGQNGAETDFLPTNQMDNLDAANDAIIVMPVPNTTPTKIKAYAAGTVIDMNVANQAGGATNTVYLYGILY